jgi:adenylate cyclase
VLVFRFETFEGRPSTHYATTRVMKADCIGCHNQDPNSTLRDWRVGDVAGVLEIIWPLDREITPTRDGLHGTFLLTAMVSGALLVLSALVLVVQSRRPV